MEIEWIIEFKFTSDEVNHVDEIINIPISPGSSFGQLNLTVDALHDTTPQGMGKVPRTLLWIGMGKHDLICVHQWFH